MNICLIGDGLISLTLAKTLINKKIKVFMYYEDNRKIPNENRTIGISSDNLDFIQKKIVKINKNLIWKINKNIDKIKIRTPNNSISLLVTKFDVFSNIFSFAF